MVRHRHRHIIVFLTDVMNYVFTFTRELRLRHNSVIWNALCSVPWNACFPWNSPRCGVASLLKPSVAFCHNLLLELDTCHGLANLLKLLHAELAESVLVTSGCATLLKIAAF